MRPESEGEGLPLTRPALGCLRERFPSVPLLALTATATERVLADVLKLLRIPHATRFTVSFNRPNLAFNVRPKVGGAAGLAAFAQHVASAYDSRACGIVYCLSRDECATVTAALVARGVAAVTYHAGMTPLQRVKAQRDWASGAARVACATIAFGMGIDKADVRFVLHFTMPKSIEGLYQEAGRAGRDGQAAEHTLFYCSGDHARCVRLTKRGRKRGRGGGGGSVASEVALCDAAKAYCTERRTCRRVLLLKYLGERREAGAAPSAAALTHPRSFTPPPNCSCDNCRRAAGTLPPSHDEPLPGCKMPKERAPRAKRAKKAVAPKRGASAKPPLPQHQPPPPRSLYEAMQGR